MPMIEHPGTTTVAGTVGVFQPQPLDRLAEMIRADLERLDQSREAWVAAMLNLCQHLAEARVQMKDNYAFGHWCDEQGFGLSHQDRAAAIEMGRHPEDARQVLQLT